MFSQLLKLFPRTEFQALVKRMYAERHARGFTCWGQCVAMLFCQLGRCQGLATGRKKFRFKNKLVSLGSTVIDLCATLFDWAKFRRTKGRSHSIACWITTATSPAWSGRGSINRFTARRPC
jgi:hypothetical protein